MVVIHIRCDEKLKHSRHPLRQCPNFLAAFLVHNRHLNIPGRRYTRQWAPEAQRAFPTAYRELSIPVCIVDLEIKASAAVPGVAQRPNKIAIGICHDGLGSVDAAEGAARGPVQMEGHLCTDTLLVEDVHGPWRAVAEALLEVAKKGICLLDAIEQIIPAAWCVHLVCVCHLHFLPHPSRERLDYVHILLDHDAVQLGQALQRVRSDAQVLLHPNSHALKYTKRSVQRSA
mmetsp:Transcript_91982/g.269037  ORF Transcript_91982/g.269037 Transcript_91982/m.269037 type:complete len:230 (+) Transcript_91982:644-1333(+)